MKRAFENIQNYTASKGKWRTIFRLAGLAVVLALLPSCHGNPNVRKQKYFESGKRYEKDGKYQEAVIQFANAVKVDKAYAAAHYELAKSYLHLRQFGPAYNELTRTVDLQPTNYSARIDLGNLLLAAGKIDEAQKQADAIQAAQPDNADLHALLSAISIRRGQAPQAVNEIQRALDLDPNRAVFHEEMALVMARDEGKAPAVEEELKKAVALDPKGLNPRFLLTAFYESKKRWTEAEQVARDAVAVSPKSIPARENLAQVFLKQGQPSGAEQVLRQAAKDMSDDPAGARLLADYYMQSGQADKAKAELVGLIAKYPKNVPLKVDYVRSLLQVRDFGTAQSVVDELMKKQSKDTQVLALHGIVLLNAGKTDEAVAALQAGVKDFPNDAFMQFWLGRAALAKGDLNLAKTSFGHAAEQNGPSKVEAEAQLALVAIMQGDMDRLSEVAEKMITLMPRSASGFVWRAMAEMSRNSLDKAEADLKTAMQLAPKGSASYLFLGKIRFAQKRYLEGAGFFEQSLQYDPNNIEALRLLVNYDLYQKQPEKALARVNTHLAKVPNNSAAYDLLAQVHASQNHLDQAATAAQKAMQLNSSDGEAVMLLAQIQVQRGQTANAVAAWEQWTNAHPKDAGALAILGTLEEARGDQPKAEGYYKKSLQIQPQQPLAANNLAYLMLQKGDNPDVALSLAQIARRAMPNSPNAADTLAWAYYHKQAYGFARDLLEEALKSDADNVAMHYHLGMVYSKMKDRNNATTHLKKVISLAPGTTTAKDATAALDGLS